jgi:hypothetical protein
MEGDFLMSEKERERKSTLERAKRKELTSLKRRRGHATSEKRNQVADETRRRPDDLTCALATRDCRALLLPTHRRYAAQRARPSQKTQQHDAAHRRSGRNPKDLDRPGETQVVVACRVPGRPGVNRDSQRPLAFMLSMVMTRVKRALPPETDTSPSAVPVATRSASSAVKATVSAPLYDRALVCSLQRKSPKAPYRRDHGAISVGLYHSATACPRLLQRHDSLFESSAVPTTSLSTVTEDRPLLDPTPCSLR